MKIEAVRGLLMVAMMLVALVGCDKKEAVGAAQVPEEPAAPAAPAPELVVMTPENQNPQLLLATISQAYAARGEGQEAEVEALKAQAEKEGWSKIEITPQGKRLVVRAPDKAARIVEEVKAGSLDPAGVIYFFQGDWGPTQQSREELKALGQLPEKPPVVLVVQSSDKIDDAELLQLQFTETVDAIQEAKLDATSAPKIATGVGIEPEAQEAGGGRAALEKALNSHAR